jgi:hypothetical protein
LAVEPLKNIDLTVFQVRESFFQRLFGYIWRIFS